MSKLYTHVTGRTQKSPDNYVVSYIHPTKGWVQDRTYKTKAGAQRRERAIRTKAVNGRTVITTVPADAKERKGLQDNINRW